MYILRYLYGDTLNLKDSFISHVRKRNQKYLRAEVLREVKWK